MIPPRAGPAPATRPRPGRGSALYTLRLALPGIVVAAFALAWMLRDLVLLVGYSVLLAYALLPVVTLLERLTGWRGARLPRAAAAAIVMLGLVTMAVWLLALALPRLAEQASNFALGAPAALTLMVEGARDYGARHGMSLWLDPAIEEIRIRLTGLLGNIVGATASWAARELGGIGALLAMALMPFLSFYLLTESGAVQRSALRFLPASMHPGITRLGSALDRALRSYVRGQALVCLIMGVVVGSGLAILGSPVALLLGLLVAFAELVPYLGFLVAAAAIAIAGLGTSGFQAVAGVVLYIVLNWVIGMVVTPQVMGRYLKMHPFIVTVSVLAGTKIFGPGGALLALPGAAMIQAAVGEWATAANARAAASKPAPATDPS